MFAAGTIAYRLEPTASVGGWKDMTARASERQQKNWSRLGKDSMVAGRGKTQGGSFVQEVGGGTV